MLTVENGGCGVEPQAVRRCGAGGASVGTTLVLKSERVPPGERYSRGGYTRRQSLPYLAFQNTLLPGPLSQNSTEIVMSKKSM